MKKLARTLSSRGSGSKSRRQPPLSDGNGIGSGSNQVHVQKSSLPSPIPPYTHIHFPQCPHTTPPTPRPAHLPTMLRTEVVEPARRPDDSTPSPASDSLGREVHVRQFLTTPTHCLDCTLWLASQQESWIRERCDAGVRELRLRLVELKSGLAALKAAEDGPPVPSHGIRSESGDGVGVGDGVQSKISTEISCHEERIEEHQRRRDGDIKKLWDQVRRDWEGGVREVVRDDGTGEAEERCVFVMPWEEEDDDDDDVVSKSANRGQAESRASVRVKWLPIEED